jgi:hypothetical protein
MQPRDTRASVAINPQVRVGGLTATRVQDDLSWGQGAIQPQAAYNSAADQQQLIEAVLQSIEPVAETELAYSACTDGRLPVKLLNGESIPVREQMVGADMVSAFYVAETLGASFYQNPAAPVAERVADVAAFLKENGLLPSSHIACGAGAGFVVIAQNILSFVTDTRYTARQQALLPSGIHDEAIRAQMLADSLACLASNGLYEGLSAQTFLDAVEHISGKRAVAELNDDGRGVHGHVEEAIVRVRLDGQAINEAKVSELTGGREVFGVNDNRIEKLARMFARGNDTDYRKAYMALEDFADAGHGTLATGLPTWIVASADQA